jgi:GT2 family glycosyltransferase
VSEAAPRPAVLAVVVATDGEATLGRTLGALAEQDYPGLTVVGVDNGSSDGSRALLQRHLPAGHVLVAERDLGFGGAVGMALDADVGRDHELVLLVHDDLALQPTAVSALVDTMLADDELAIVGCKLVEWDEPRRLQAVGMSVDVTGRADPGVEPDELDQGQRDTESRTLYVSTAGMLVRRDRFEALGRFDPRYHLFRDDLDLCWRAWLWGWSVEVVPDAVGAHDQSAATYKRLGQTAFLGPRYFAERNTLATLLKNYGPLRLLLVVPLFLVVGVLKVVGFVLTRRLGDAWQTLRAWAWNVLHLLETRRLRRRVQRGRARGDGELVPLFAQVTARVRAYAEAVGGLLWRGSDEIGLEDDPTARDGPELTLWQRLLTRVRTSPVGIAAVVLFVLGVFVSLPLLSTSPIVGGELALWPSGPWAMFEAYVSPEAVGDLPAVASVTPAQVLLTVPSALAFGAEWLAPRLLLLSIVPIAWIAALRAGRLITPRRLPRVAGATLYALSPPLLAALRTGRIGSAVAAALAPLVVIAAARATLPGVPRDRAWRAAATAALVTAATVAFAPVTVLLIGVAAVAVAVAIAIDDHADVGERLVRLAVVVVGAGLLLLPWSPFTELRRTPFLGDVVAEQAPSLASLLLLTPDLPGFPGVLAGIGLAAAVVLGLGLFDRRGAAAGLLVVYVAAVFGAWRVALFGEAVTVWVGAPLVIAAVAAGGLLVGAIAGAEAQLGAHDFGWRQLGAVAVAVVVVVGTVAASLSVVSSAWEGYGDEQPLPAYIATEVDVEGIGPFRVLVLGDDGESVRWSITDPDGPTAASWGHTVAPEVVDVLDDRVAAVLGGADRGAAADLGRLGVRYVVVPTELDSDRLLGVLDEQLDLIRQTGADGAVYGVTTWLPRLAVVSSAGVDAIGAGWPLPPAVTATRYDEDLAVADSASLVLADPVDPAEPGVVVVDADGGDVAPTVVGDVLTWSLPSDEASVDTVPDRVRTALLVLQAFVFVTVVSLALRAPRFAREATS